MRYAVSLDKSIWGVFTAAGEAVKMASLPPVQCFEMFYMDVVTLRSTWARVLQSV